MIPEFNDIGNLPLGIHPATWQEFYDRFSRNTHRQKLLRGLRMALEVLKAVGCRRVFIDGSFVTTKEFPGDFDVLWDIEGVDDTLLLNIEPIILLVLRDAQKAKFGGEFFPINHLDDSWDAWLNFFQADRQQNPKGIVSLDLESL